MIFLRNVSKVILPHRNIGHIDIHTEDKDKPYVNPYVSMCLCGLKFFVGLNSSIIFNDLLHKIKILQPNFQRFLAPKICQTVSDKSISMPYKAGNADHIFVQKYRLEMSGEKELESN